MQQQDDLERMEVVRMAFNPFWDATVLDALNYLKPIKPFNPFWDATKNML